MNWLPHVSSTYFAIAALVCAAGPVVIHLLNRRRFRVIEWAAMDFLAEALQLQKRKLRLRDLLLLLLRTAAVLLFGLALARPYFASDRSHLDANSPRHLILLFDNSLSMGYRHLDTTLLDQARRQAGRLIESLPNGSQVSILETCPHRRTRHGPMRGKADALELLKSVQLVDGVSKIEEVVAMARRVIGTAAPLADQIIYFTDLQRGNWPSDIDPALFQEFPILNIRDVSNRTWQNSWIAEVRLRDDVVDLDTPATVFVTIRHHGPVPRRTQVSLTVGAQVVASRSIELPAGDSQRQITFECSFADAPAELGEATFVPLQAALAPDRLPQDDRRTIMVPVVTSLPVVFVDQYDDQQEDPALGQLGETRPLRHLLAPRSTQQEQRPLVEVRHVAISGVDRALLASARLVVVAGLSDPQPVAGLLRQYVQQGGPLVIAAGGAFDLHAWNMIASQPSTTLLPGRIAPQPLGVAPDEAGTDLLEPFSLSIVSLLSDPLFRLPGLSDDELREIYQEPLFFKAVVLDLASSTDQLAKPLAKPVASARWLTWESPGRDIAAPVPSENADGKRRFDTRVCARFADPSATPFLVRHRIGKGQVLFASSSILPTWNNVAQTNAVVMWDHLLRGLIRSTLPQRNFATQDELSIPVPTWRAGPTAQVQRPDTSSAGEIIDVGFVERSRYGVVIPDAWSRGVYRINSIRPTGATDLVSADMWHLEIAANGDARESDLTPLSSDDIQTDLVAPRRGRIFDGQSLGTLDRTATGNVLWWWFILIALVLLITELAILAFSTRATRVASETAH